MHTADAPHDDGQTVGMHSARHSYHGAASESLMQAAREMNIHANRRKANMFMNVGLAIPPDRPGDLTAANDDGAPLTGRAARGNRPGVAPGCALGQFAKSDVDQTDISSAVPFRRSSPAMKTGAAVRMNMTTTTAVRTTQSTVTGASFAVAEVRAARPYTEFRRHHRSPRPNSCRSYTHGVHLTDIHAMLEVLCCSSFMSARRRHR